MVKKCIYCGSHVEDDCVIDFCERCGISVWGEKMFRTIIKNMEDARSNGDLLHNQKEFCGEANFGDQGVSLN
jgi:uncharacterized UBP type Zn finger protein